MNEALAAGAAGSTEYMAAMTKCAQEGAIASVSTGDSATDALVQKCMKEGFKAGAAGSTEYMAAVTKCSTESAAATVNTGDSATDALV